MTRACKGVPWMEVDGRFRHPNAIARLTASTAKIAPPPPPLVPSPRPTSSDRPQALNSLSSHPPPPYLDVLHIFKMSGAAASAGASKFQAFMNHPAGPKTVFFWAPMMKWCLVAAGLKDLSRPADKLSVSQNLALAATGFIWVRYSFVITPVNVSLAAVNFFVGSTGLGQLARIWHYQRTQDDPVARYFGTAGPAMKVKSEATAKTA
ncbi:hypothetical protein GSI_03687 [Ganoderma sinense ZZ0214-1]|uniref:Mitochondrial pyruvate carrier n=1 Tax=Ganoderma sinense ZZ0214-1 TaxID=1077348 RepID=A0A2G8SJP2_9APHY|nr:hypothetical protein GSI_03687 [Ganoderma sinense ZZ0214-1]